MALLSNNGIHTLFSQGKYDAFPMVAGNGDRVITAWRSAAGHGADKTAVVRGSVSTDGGRNWATPTVVWDDPTRTGEEGSAGLTWNPVLGEWNMLLLRRSPELGARFLRSDDGVSWSLVTSTIPKPASVQWWFPSSLATLDDGTLVAGLYGNTKADPTGPWVAFLISSADGGVTWTLRATMSDPGGGNVGEPQVCQCPDGSWIAAANTGHAGGRIVAAYSADGLDWPDTLQTILNGFEGEPAVGVSYRSGTMMMLLRRPSIPDDTHGLWAYAVSDDNGMSWDVRDDFPDQARFMLYGGIIETDDGGLALVFSSEDDPDRLWGTATIYYTRFVPARLEVSLDFSQPAPAFRVVSSARGQVQRVWTDILGQEITEDVRDTGFDGDTQWGVDYEIQQGRTYTYQCGDLNSDPVTAPVLDSMVLVHPLHPDWSMPVIVADDMDGRSYGIDLTKTPVPGRRPGPGSSMSSAIVTTSGMRGSGESSTTLKTETLLDKARMLRLVSDGTPLFWSAHPGSDMPEWISVDAQVTEKRFVNMCSHNHDDPADNAQWRLFTLPWIEQDRPTRRQLPIRRRLKDYQQPLSTLVQPLGEL